MPLLKQLCPPEQFGIVEPGIYRSNTLYPLNFPFITQLNLKTVVQLSPESPPSYVVNLFILNYRSTIKTFFAENKIEHVSAPTNK